MDDDEDFLGVNFSVVGCIFLEFTNALSEYMVSKVKLVWKDRRQRTYTYQRLSFFFLNKGLGRHYKRGASVVSSGNADRKNCRRQAHETWNFY
jgi:hypothetical protein